MGELNPLFFSSAKEFRKWLKANHTRRTELWVGFYKKATGIPSITWPESVEQALCYGWIDGIRKSIDDASYKIRFTPRKPDSHWSDVNIKLVKKLKKEGLMQPAGLKAFEARTEKKSRRASYEQARVNFNTEYEKKLKLNKKAWKYFSSQAPSYQKQTMWWIMSAKREDTRLKRLEILIQSSEEGQYVPPLRWTQKKSN